MITFKIPSDNMKVEQFNVVELTYVLTVDGQVVDKSQDKPLDFIQGTGCLLPKFEENIEGLEPGSKFAFTLTPEEGYGVFDPERVIPLPKDAFIIDGTLREDLMVIGNTIPLMNSAGGVVPGKVIAVEGDIVKIDINHPMVDKTLNFEGEIVSVRKATEKELSEGLHGEFVHHSCDCCGHDHCHEGGCHGDHGECGHGHCHEDGCHGDHEEGCGCGGHEGCHHGE